MPVLIPKTFHHIWLGSPVHPEHARRQETFAHHNPGWKNKVWTDKDITTRYADLASRCPHFAQRTDIYRYEILFREGGVFVDSDFECLQPLDPVLDNVSAFSVVENDKHTSAGFIGAVPGHPLYADLLHHLPLRFNPAEFTALGPLLFTEMAARHRDLVIFPRDVFYGSAGRTLHHPRSGTWAGDDAQFVSQLHPRTVRARSPFDLSLTLKNTGSTVWSELDKARLGSQSPSDNMTWGRHRVTFPYGIQTEPGGTLALTFTLTAPRRPGPYALQWRMLREAVHWFGQPSTATLLHVL